MDVICHRRAEGVRADPPEAAEVAADPGQAFADFVGVAVDCVKGASMCSAEDVELVHRFLSAPS